MAVVFKWLLRIFLGLAALAFCALLLAYYFASRSLPDYDADRMVAGIDGQVEIVRDNHAIPHIFGQSDADVYFGLGYAHAQDRLWQMTMQRRTAQGRLSELFGEATADIDVFVRTLDLYAAAQKSYAAQSADGKRALDAYAAGVNAWLRVVQEDALGRGAPEFFLFEPKLSPWTPADSIATVKIMSLQLSSHLQYEVIRARATLAIGAERIKDILPDDPSKGYQALPDFAQLFEGEVFPAPRDFAAHHPLHPIKDPQFAGASNAFAAMPSHTTGGASLLATDPHLGLQAPGVMMLARLELQSGGVIGASLPGVPGVLIGRSDALAWGLTTAYIDDADLYVEKLNPDNEDEYLTPDGYVPFRTKDVILEIDGATPRTLNLRFTQNGPVLPPATYKLGDITPQGHVMAAAMTVTHDDDASVSALIGLAKAKSVSQARDAVAGFQGPGQNLTLADATNVGQVVAGWIPKRDPAHGSQGRIPSQGWRAENRWQGRAPFTDNPWVTSPESGYVANTNNKTTDRAFPKHVSHRWGDNQRHNRLQKLLTDRDIHTRDSFMEAQLDPLSFTARSLLPLVAKELWFAAEAAPAGTPEERRRMALDMLANWNGEMDQHVPEPLIYAAWMRNLQQRLIADELGPLAEEFTHVNPLFLERVYRDIQGASVWCDIRTSTKAENCVDLAVIALDEALLELTQAYGNRIEAWRWGQAHQAHHDHQVLGKIPLLSWFVNIRQDTSGGDNTLQRARTAGKGPEPYANIHAAAFRSVVDFSDLDSSLHIISTGQSGHFLSRHYDDLAQLWRRGEYIPMSLDPDLARSGALGITELTPKE